MRNKTAAGLFALFLGSIGVHRFYLGQVGLGILYFFLLFILISPILALIDAIVFFSMDEETFNRKYNTNQQLVPPIYHQRRPGYPPPAARQPARGGRSTKPTAMELQNPYKSAGIKKYKDFDLEGAIEDFNKGLEIQPNDISLHFNLACAYSLTEQVDKAYAHLDKAVALGFTDFEKIKSHDDLAYVRIQDRFDEFKEHGFRLHLPAVETKAAPVEAVKETIQDDVLLSQLKRLAELRDRGLLSEQEFIIEKKKLTR
jgi:TM2 domain-containing membrane protein YozV